MSLNQFGILLWKRSEQERAEYRNHKPYSSRFEVIERHDELDYEIERMMRA